jgi:hypothetical protein
MKKIIFLFVFLILCMTIFAAGESENYPDKKIITDEKYFKIILTEEIDAYRTIIIIRCIPTNDLFLIVKDKVNGGISIMQLPDKYKEIFN